MSSTALAMTRIEASTLLRLIGVAPSDGSPLQTLVAESDEAAEMASLVERGLIVPDGDGFRVNLAVGLTLATLAQPDETLDLHFADPSGERSISIATTRGHSVGVRPNGEDLKLVFPLGRPDLVSAIRNGMAAETNTQVSIGLCLSPVGQFLVGVLARHGTEGGLSLSDLSAKADEDILNRGLALGTAMLQPGTLDRLFRNPEAARVEVEQLLAAGAVIQEGATIELEANLGSVLGSPPTGSVTALRTVHAAPALSDSVTVLRFPDSILVLRLIATDGVPSCRMSTATDVQAADTIAGLLFSETELRALIDGQEAFT